MLINNGAVSTKYYSKADIQNWPLGFSIQGNGLHNYIYDLPLLSFWKSTCPFWAFVDFYRIIRYPGLRIRAIIKQGGWIAKTSNMAVKIYVGDKFESFEIFRPSMDVWCWYICPVFYVTQILNHMQCKLLEKFSLNRATRNRRLESKVFWHVWNCSSTVHQFII